ncbi:Dolichyl-phosphate-mannose-protein mannosyltransferase [Granulicella rosea]|uniref:Dolichyl-phosphate-mannose-protein mannosyltransferase n=1 Tax=Granulicella rosea TaxID=474952 RepID=A0A239L4L5_9BACT|nr:Dolichyl-phosphate-mannose-protein mannosyltransferase [Granulicella rosea]
MPLWTLYPLLFVGVYISHLTLLRLPYFWDEAGYYIPAALDLFRTGSLIPQTTLTNAHPPLPSLLLAGWWHLAGYAVWNTRVFICMVSAAALLGAFRLARELAGPVTGAVVVLLTALYPVWFAQSTLAHADIFAAAFTLWALSVYFEHRERPRYLLAAVLFSLAALAKETAIVTPGALALWELVQIVSSQPRKPVILSEAKDPRILPGAAQNFEAGAKADPTENKQQRNTGVLHSVQDDEHSSAGWRWIATLLAPILPLAFWYAYHFHKTGFIFGNPEFLRYNATANLGPLRILLSLWHRAVHLTLHMNLFVPAACAAAVLLMPRLAGRTLSKQVVTTLAVILLGNGIAFSILGGALLTRYLLPMYPLVLLLCVVVWRERFAQWWVLAGLTTVGFLAALWINPPYVFSPEDNLSYRDMIVVHQQAAAVLTKQFPLATVLTAWPATQELARPELGYVRQPFKVAPIENFSAGEIERAAQDPGGYDTALVFSTKCVPAPGMMNLARMNEGADTRFFDFHRDLPPKGVAAILHGDVVWQATRGCESAAILRFPRAVDAELRMP